MQSAYRERGVGMTSKGAKVLKAAKVAARTIGAFLATVAENPIVFNTPKFDQRRRSAGDK